MWNPSLHSCTARTSGRSDVNLVLSLRDETLLFGLTRWLRMHSDMLVYRIQSLARFGGAPPLRESTLDTTSIAAFRFGVDADREQANGDLWELRRLLQREPFQLDGHLRHRDAADRAPLPYAATRNRVPSGTRRTSRQGRRRWAFLAQNSPRFPDVSLAAASAETILGVNPDFGIPYSAHVTTGVTPSSNSGLSVSADYTFRHEFDAPTGRNFNYELVNGVYRVKDPRLAGFAGQNGGFICYNGPLTRVEFRRSARAQAGALYTLSKATSNTSTGLSVGGTTHPFDLSEDLGADDNDRRHNFVLDGSLRIPWDVQFAGLFAILRV